MVITSYLCLFSLPLFPCICACVTCSRITYGSQKKRNIQMYLQHRLPQRHQCKPCQTQPVSHQVETSAPRNQNILQKLLQNLFCLQSDGAGAEFSCSTWSDAQTEGCLRGCTKTTPFSTALLLAGDGSRHHICTFRHQGDWQSDSGALRG